ncbi:MAG: AraC family transcriptional regulator [Spirochaetaceae bacterium]|nr:MAG: AraC family transcriptional regulator [Spirochaetaceae bacterium]
MPCEQLSINSAARFSCSPDWSWDTGPAGLSDRDLWAVLSGVGTLTVGQKPYEVGRGDVFVLPPRVRIVGRHDPSRPLIVVGVHFSGGGELPFHVKVVPVEFLAGILDRVVRNNLLRRRSDAETWLHVGLAEIRTAAVAGASGTLVEAVSVACDRIRDRPGDDWRVSDIAASAGVSQQHLGRVFVKHTGLSPRAFIVHARISAAQAYLRGTSLPAKRIADELGFHDESHFSRQFSRLVGVPPSAYRSRDFPDSGVKTTPTDRDRWH